MNRREFLGTALAAATASNPKPILDTHIHLFDTNRPQGVPWPSKTDAVLYKPALPARYCGIAVPLGVRGAIAIECSPWAADNQWLLNIARANPIVIGVIGDLEPADGQFANRLDALRRDPLFLGIRYGNLWGRSLTKSLDNRGFVAGLRHLAGAGLTLDTANPDPDLLHAVVRATDMVPTLRVVLDHLPRLDMPADANGRKACEADLRELGARPQVFVKVSGVLRRIKERVPAQLSVYRATLDEIWGRFGVDRLVYGSDWPDSDLWAPYPVELKVVREYFEAKGSVAAQKYFWKNSIAAYRWAPREAKQRFA
ncbi:MAG TPA: amidohydrolase family protein [Bryobacteraceae bacterium]|nr:amidohydrolase family protein [Bryobacteraceae bacterium]